MNAAEPSNGGMNAERMVWIFGSGRSGSTWLRSMMSEMSGHRVWEEPMVGRLFGEFYSKTLNENRRSAEFIMGDPIKKGWLHSIRNFVLDGARYSNPGWSEGEYLVVKEPNGSIGAPLVMEALPESRMILLIRDPRDVVSSVLDAAKKGGWMNERRGRDDSRSALADSRPNAFVRNRAKLYRQGVGNALRAYENHQGPKTLVKYEDLRKDTLETMRRIYADLRIPCDGNELARAVEKHAWENVPKEEKGEGKFYRKASPGGWREDLTPKQARIVRDITAPISNEFYP